MHFSFVSPTTIFLLVGLVVGKYLYFRGHSMDVEEHGSVTRFREYLRIMSVRPDPVKTGGKLLFPDKPSYVYREGYSDWIRRQAVELGLEFNIVEFPKFNESLIRLTWIGRRPSLSSILLHSHVDLVQLETDPFAVDEDVLKTMFAIESLGIKAVGFQYLEAIRKLKIKDFIPLRTIHILFVPDAEFDGSTVLAPFIESPEFEDLNVGLALTEGIPSPSQDEDFIVTYSEQTLCQVNFTVKGSTSHSLILQESNVGEKIQKVINRLLEFSNEEKARLESNPDLTLGDVTTASLTGLGGGMPINGLPTQLTVSFDIHLSPKWNKRGLLQLLDEIVQNAGPDVSHNYFFPSLDYTVFTPSYSVWRSTFESTCFDLDIKLKPIIMPGTSDIRYLRARDIPTFGFSPMNSVPVMFHTNDELLNESVFLRRIDIYEMLIWNLANLPDYNFGFSVFRMPSSKNMYLVHGSG